MKKPFCVIAAALLLLTACTNGRQAASKPAESAPTAYVSAITSGECFVCGQQPNGPATLYWGQENIGVIDLNTFELLYLPINRYDDSGALMEEPAGYVCTQFMQGEDSCVYGVTNPDRGYAHIQIQGERGSIDPTAVQERLCQSCLDGMDALRSAEAQPETYALIHFGQKSIRPLIEHTVWFSMGDYGIFCDFKENGNIFLLVSYCPPRYE